MSTVSRINQGNKEAVWDFWQKLNHVGADKVPDTVRAAVHGDVDWNVSAPISSTSPMSSWAASMKARRYMPLKLARSG